MVDKGHSFPFSTRKLSPQQTVLSIVESQEVYCENKDDFFSANGHNNIKSEQKPELKQIVFMDDDCISSHYLSA